MEGRTPLRILAHPHTAPASGHRCAACGENFQSSLSLDFHSCSVQQWLPCYLCNQVSFRTRIQLIEHLKNSCFRCRQPLRIRKRHGSQKTYDKYRKRVCRESYTPPKQSSYINRIEDLGNIPHVDYKQESTHQVSLRPEGISEPLHEDTQENSSHFQPPIHPVDIENDLYLTDSSPSSPIHTSADSQVNTPVNALTIVETALGGYAKTYQISCSKDSNYDIDAFLRESIPLIASTLQNELLAVQGVKYNLWLETNYVNPTGEITDQLKNFKTTNSTIYKVSPSADITKQISRGMDKIKAEMEEQALRGSGWTFHSIYGLQLRISKCHLYMTAPRGYIRLPKEIAGRRACLNVINNDEYCFKHAIISKRYTGSKTQIKTEDITSVEHNYNFSNLFFPMPLSGISKFEKQNPACSVNVFTLDAKHMILPVKIVEKEKEDHFDLLLISCPENPENKHYVLIRDFERLIRKQISINKNRVTICKRCFTFKRNVRCQVECKTWLEEHQKYCNSFRPAEIVLPTQEEGEMAFRNISHHYKIPIVIYCDLESTLAPISRCENSSEMEKTAQIHHHEINSFALLLKTELPDTLLKRWDIPNTITLRREDNAAFKLMTYLKHLAQNIESLYSQNVPMKKLTPEQEAEFNSSTECTFCKTAYSETVIKVRDHCHLTGEYRSSYCQSCNLNLKVPFFIPVIFHNLSGYDSHFLIKVLGMFKNRISIIPSSSEKFISFSVFVGKIELRFLDSLKFTLCSLDSLVKTVPHEDLKETAKMLKDKKKIELCIRKGVYPYDYIDSIEKFNETSLPPQEAFYNKLTESHITDEDYAHAVKVWNEFNCETLGNYHDLYLKLDVTLLCDIMEAFRKVCYNNYHLDPFHSYTAPGLSWNAMLKNTGITLDLITDYDIYMYIESAVRGGLVQCNLRHATANNPDLENPDDYDPDKPTSHIMYFDATNLYGSVMCESLPFKDFKWVKNINTLDYRNIPDDSPVGYLIEADYEYPEELHDDHNDFPLLPKSEIPPGGGLTKKLLATLKGKTSYIAHHSICKLAEDLGLKITKVKRALQFRQSDWLKPYIMMNTKLRQQAVNTFESNFFKLMSNSVYGKSCENQKKRVNIKLVRTEKEFLKETAKVNFLDRTIISENLIAVHLTKRRIKLNRPLYIGQCILDLAKKHMYNFHYNVMLPNFRNIVLCYTDTDSLIYYIVTSEPLNVTLSKLAKYFDFSTYPKGHPLYNAHLPENTKKLGTFKDETAGRQIQEEVGLKSKMYAFRFNSKAEKAGKDVHMKAKGIQSMALKKQFLFNHYKRTLFENESFDTSFNVIRSRKHEVFTEKVKKQALTAHDDKRYILADGIHTLAYGHYLLENP